MPLTSLKSELVKRFGCFINVNIPSFKPHYVLAAILDPFQAFLVDVDAENISRLIAERIGYDVGSETQSDAEAGTPDDEASYEELMRKKRKLEKRSSSQTQPAGLDNRLLVEAKGTSIRSFTKTSVPQIHPLEWWRFEGYVKFPNVHSLALNYLAAPATSASIERTFRHGGLALSGSKNRTQAELLNMKLMFHLNENISS
ncbi:hATC-domain-containing protein [Aphelenchoides avenae]|nr:hATC-domain-containing protein [Aphelenchus avenae]